MRGIAFRAHWRRCCDDWYDPDGKGWPWRCTRPRGHRSVHAAHGTERRRPIITWRRR